MSEARPTASGSGMPLFTFGFRPFFLLAAIYAALGLGAWVAYLAGAGDLPAASVAPSVWHAREMLFGYALAVVAGFFLTAVPGWTGTAPLRGAPLAGLALVWLAGRVAAYLGDVAPQGLASAIDLAFAPLLALAVVPAIVAARKPHNLVPVVLLAVLWVANLLVHLEALGVTVDTAGPGIRLGVDTLALLIAIIGGRVVPAFTGNALSQAGVEAGVVRRAAIDRAAILLCVAVLIADLTLPGSLAAGAAALLAAVALALRMSGWRTMATLGQPILWVLHLGYAWLIAGYALKGLAGAADLLPETAALHALTIGAIGTMTLAIMSRASLGHTGRPLVAPRPTVAAYALVGAAALVRVAGAALLPGSAMEANILAGALWTLAFILLLIDYAPVLLGRDVREG